MAKKLFKVTAERSIIVVAEDVNAAKVIAASKFKIEADDPTIRTEFISDIDVVATRSNK